MATARPELVKWARLKALQNLPFASSLTRFRLPILLGCAAWLAAFVASAKATAGGGFVGAGISGAYYGNTGLSGSAAFNRTDVRVDFDWGTTGSPGGSSSPGFAEVAGNAFSVVWTGQILAKYSETYTFKTVTTGGVVLSIAPAHSSSWTTVVNDWTAHATTTDTGSYALLAGQAYDVKVQYFNNQANAVARLHWSSPSTPEEAIEPAAPIGVNAGTATDYDASVMFADAMKMAHITPGVYSSTPLDAQGWPMGDGDMVIYAGQPTDCSGRYRLTFTGTATVGFNWTSIANVTQAYDTGSNTTTIAYTVTDATANSLQLQFSNTRRAPSDTTATGITNLQIMRPQTPGDTANTYPAGTLFTSGFKSLLAKFTTVRFMDYFAMNTNGNSVLHWSDRLLPSYSTQQGINGGYQGQGGAVEYAVEVCNETGRDFWLNIPVQADDNFVTQLALGLKYGFGTNGLPYTSAQANPAYPPLQPNLRVYLEFSNETWNWGFEQTSIAYQSAQTEVNNQTATGLILNYDNVNDPYVWAKRWLILRCKVISDLFRGVWGDAAMMQTVRPLFLYQYANDNNTAVDAFQFLDNYFNNADGSHVAMPQPVNHYLYAGGGGWYNSVLDSSGTGASVVTDAGFEFPALPVATSQLTPAGGGWAFRGAAGMVSNNPRRAAAATTTTVGAAATPGGTVGVGYAFTVGAAPIYVNQIGRYVGSGNNQYHDLYLLDANHNTLAFTTVNAGGAIAGQYVYGNIGSVCLAAQGTYYILSVESGEAYYDQGSQQTTFSGISTQNAVTVTMPNEWDPSTWTWSTGTAGHVAGPVDFLYSTVPGAGPVAYPPDAQDGTQAAFVQNGGQLSQSLTFPAGVSDIAFYAAQGTNGTGSYTVLVDGTPVLVGWSTANAPNNYGYSLFRTTGINLSAGVHTVAFAGSGNGTVLLDGVTVESAAAMLSSGLGDIGPTVRTEANWDLAYGLKTAGYEGGFEVGGDSPSAAANAANVDPRVQQGTAQTLSSYLVSGGDLPIVFNTAGGAYGVAMDFPYGTDDIYSQNTPKMAAYGAASAALPPAVTNATLVPRALTAANMTLFLSDSGGNTYADSAGNVYLPAGWLSWNIVVPVHGTYTLSSSVTGTGGRYVLLLDEATVVSGATGGTLTGTTTLYPGLHCLKVRSTGSTPFQVTGVTVAETGAPTAPVLNSAVFTNAECALTWTAVSGAAGYTVAYGHAPGAYTTFLNVGQATSAVLTGLDNSQVYYLAVYASDGSGDLSLFSNEKRAAARSTAPAVTVDFEGLTIGATQSLWSFGGMNFAAFGNSGTLQIQGASDAYWPGPWPSNVLWSEYWGNQHSITASNSAPFDLYSLDLLVIDQVQSARLTGYDASGSSFSQIVNFNTFDGQGHAVAHVTLDWTQVVRVVISWSSAPDGANTDRFGAIDNVVFNQAQAAAAIPTQLIASAASAVQVNLSWSDLSAPGGYIIDRSTSSDFSVNLVSIAIAPSGGNSVTYTDSTVTLTGSTVYYYRVRALSGTGESANTSTAWVASAGLPPLLAWRLANFGTADGTGTAADLANPSGDGMSNLVKYALGGHPSRPDASSVAPVILLDGSNHLQITYFCNAACTDITYTVQASDDMVTWTSVANSLGGVQTVPINGLSTVSDTGTGLRKVTVTDSGGTGARRFLRLTISSQ